MHDFPIPKELVEIQTWFANIITAPIQNTDEANLPIYSASLIDAIGKRIASSPHLRSEERLGIYNQQYWWRLLTVMQELYPSLVRLFDYRDFNHLITEPYLLHCPPNEWFLSRIGSGLPEWLTNHYREKDASLVIELARIDLAYETLIFTELMPKIQSDALQSCEKKRLYLQPYVMLFEYKADLFTFRTQLLERSTDHWQTHDFPNIRKADNMTYFVLFRNDEQNFYEEISESRFRLLSRFQQGAKLIDLISLLTNCDGVVEWFQLIAERGWLSFLNPNPSVSRKRSSLKRESSYGR
jgi:hypothetical protein